MRSKYLYFVGILAFLLIGNFSLSAQSSLKIIRDRGPMFITSVSFFQGIQRFPYKVVPGEEDFLQNRKDISIPVVSVSQFAGYQFSPYFALGLGLNFEYWTVKNAFVPIYVDLRFNMLKSKIAPHAYLNLGYATRWYIDSKPYKVSTGNSNDYIIHGATSGAMAELGLGVKASVGFSKAVVITASAKIQETALRYYSGNTDPSQSMKPLLVNTNANGLYLFIGVKAGFVF